MPSGTEAERAGRDDEDGDGGMAAGTAAVHRGGHFDCKITAIERQSPFGAPVALNFVRRSAFGKPIMAEYWVPQCGPTLQSGV
ncbi:hypothetical protein BSZ35_12830 [Salinibacter sp. 10B]|nr:hypothetical protein BSZ35_12830 [Salinibacter sp. 10B]